MVILIAVLVILVFTPAGQKLDDAILALLGVVDDVPCSGDDLDRCREVQYRLQPIAQDSCAGDGRRVCLVPLGLVSPELMQHLVDHYQEQYGLTVTVLRPLGIPKYVVDSDRRQVGGSALINSMLGAFPDELADPNVVLIGVTPLDLYFEQKDWRFAFGVRGMPEDPKSVVSTFRMNPETFGEDRDDGLLFTRARKMVSRHIGLLYYGLPESSDPESLLYSSILSLRDLDRLQEPLPVTPDP